MYISPEHEKQIKLLSDILVLAEAGALGDAAEQQQIINALLGTSENPSPNILKYIFDHSVNLELEVSVLTTELDTLKRDFIEVLKYLREQSDGPINSRAVFDSICSRHNIR